MILGKQRKYPVPLDDVDLSGRIKMETLEEVFLEELIYGWCTAKDLFKYTVLGAEPYQSKWRCISIRLLRYHRSGLLTRRRKGRRFEYRLSEKGEDRLHYLWTRFNRLKPKPGWESKRRMGEIERELTELTRICHYVGPTPN